MSLKNSKGQSEINNFQEKIDKKAQARKEKYFFWIGILVFLIMFLGLFVLWLMMLGCFDPTTPDYFF